MFNLHNAQQSQPSEQQERWKSQAFINVRISDVEGKKHKVGTLYLKANNKVQAALIEALSEDPDNTDHVESVMSKLEFDFQLAADDTPVKLAL